MNRDDHLNNIAKYFGRLSHEIRALNALGRFDINSVTEDFLIPVLKVMFDCPDLQNQNEIQINFPGVDLGCRTTKVSFQVTTDGSSSKIQKTLEKFHKHELGKIFDHVYVLVLADKQSSYNATSLARAISDLTIPFEPDNDILDINDILSRVRRLETSKLERIDDYLASGWVKRDRRLRFRNQFDEFLAFSTNKIDVEKRSRKYIPSIFVETHSTKEEMRLFANPLFFYRKIQDKLRYFEYDHLNSRLGIAKEPELVLDLDGELLTDMPSTFADLDAWLDRVDEAIGVELAKVRPLSWWRVEGEMTYKPVNGDSAGWMIARLQVESAASGLASRLKDARALIKLIRNKIFLITSMAGQGKTNFVCDLVENQFRLFEIPCLFIPARELNGYAPGKRILEYISHNRYASDVTKIHDYLDLFNDVALETNKPFLIAIDGINEVADLNSFSDELKAFCNAVSQYEMIKIIITCRSEFFDEKFASMLDEPFSVHVHRVSDLRSEMTDLSKSRLLKSYFTHFKITGKLGRIAEDFLKTDFLLLRIFCERYEGGDVGYMADIYKGDLFVEYLCKKVGSFPENLQTRALPTLFKIVSAMLAANNYAKLSVRDFTSKEQEIVRRFVEDDVILRQEIGTEGLAAVGDLAISFTYDELRDFVIAYKLVDEAAADNGRALKDALAQLPGRPTYEGVYRYAYLLARKANDAAVIAACENGQDFTEHFSLNVHLLPPTAQTSDDVARVKDILADVSTPVRLRRVVVFLVHRCDPAELLNITILIDHLNGLETDDHAKFVRAIFAHQHDYEAYAWQQRIGGLIKDVSEDGTGRGLTRFTPEWLAFFLHASSLAGWAECERVSMQFREAQDASNCREAMELVHSAHSTAVHHLLSDIEKSKEA